MRGVFLSAHYNVFFSGCVSSIGFGGGVVAIVHPIQAPIPRMAMKAMSTGMATSQSLMVSRGGQNMAIV